MKLNLIPIVNQNNIITLKPLINLLLNIGFIC